MKDKDFINQTLTPLCSTKNTRRVANLHQIMKSDKKELLLNCTLLYHIVFCITTPYRINSATPQVNSYILITIMSFQDIGKRGATRPIARSGTANGFGAPSASQQQGNSSKRDDYTSASQSILQYQVSET
jgi:hypothetical protein